MRKLKSVRYSLALFAVLLIASGASAQVTTGRLIGTVVDEDGGALPGATVKVDSESLLGGERIEITNTAGYFTFVGLPVGLYTVQAALDGFVTQQWSNVKVSLAGATSLEIELPQGTFSNVVEVTGEAPVIDPTQVSMEQVFDANFLKEAAIGSGGRSYQQMLYQAAGAESSVEALGNPSVFGSTSGENTYYIDGMDTTDPITSTFAANFNFDAIEEIQFQTAGFEAEYGRTIGGVVNLVTKSGGNEFTGTFDTRYRNEDFYESGDHYDADELKAERTDIAVSLGGPLVRDKLWFFMAYEYVKNEETPSWSTNTYSFEGNYPFAKLSWAIAPSWRLVAKYSGDPTTIDNANARDTHYADPNAMSYRDGGGYILNAELSAVLTDSLLWNTNIGIKRSVLDQVPYQDPNVMSHYSYYTGQYTENDYRQDFSNRDRDEFATDLTWFVEELGGSHEFKFGVEIGKFMENNSTICVTNPSSGEYGCQPGTTGSYFRDHQRYEDFQHPYYLYVEETIPPEDFVGDMYSGFIQDAWRPMPDLTLKLGVRYDEMTWSDNDGTERIWFEKFQPRLGFAWDITGNATNVLRGNYGRFMHPANSSVPGFLTTSGGAREYYASCSYAAERFGWGEPYQTAEECQAIAAELGFDWIEDDENWDPSGWLGPFYTIAGSPTEVDPNLSPTYADEYALSYERSVGRRASVEVSYIHKETKDILEDTCRGNFYDGPSEDADCEAFLIFNHPERKYEGLTVKYETRSYEWMTLIGSYTYSESKGTADTRHYFWGDWDTYPYEWMNMYGYTMMHRPHRLKLNGFFLLPSDTTIGFDFSWADKFRYNSEDDEYPDAPPVTVLSEPRGSREGNSNYNIDLQFSKGFTVGNLRLVAIASILNATSTERPANATDVCENVHGCANPEGEGLVEHGAAIDWTDPRSYELGFRIEF